MDVHNKEARSYNMSRIKGRDTKPELLVRKFLYKHGYRYRLHVKTLPGKPDIVLTKYKTVIFIHGCFWHGHEGCKYFVVPKTRTDWWLNKINNTKTLDTNNTKKLILQNWTVLEIWECELKNNMAQKTLSNLVCKL